MITHISSVERLPESVGPVDVVHDNTLVNGSTALLRLLQLSSPQLPVGAYTFSQGLEAAQHLGWLSTAEELSCWLEELLSGPMQQQELPLLSRLFDAFQCGDPSAARYWSQFALACRETAEFREEERDRARALYRVLSTLSVEGSEALKETLQLTPLAGVALAAIRWSIPKQALLQAHGFAWLENQVAAGIKLIPLGQNEGQILLFSLAEYLPDIVVRSERVLDEEIGFSSMSLTKASCLHETQYSKLYRS